MSNYHFTLIDPVIDSEETIIAIKNNAMNLLLEVKSIIEFRGEGVEVKKQMLTDLENVIMDCNRALKLKDPAKYGPVVRQSSVVRVR